MHITILQSTYINGIIGAIRASTTDDCCVFLVSLPIGHQIGSARGMLIVGGGYVDGSPRYPPLKLANDCLLSLDPVRI